MAKYAGADWVPFKLSTFSAVVADILGQVYLGIYHIDSAVTSKKAKWGEIEVSVPIYGSIATYDFDELTRLVFCCHAAGVEVSLEGASKRYLRFMFRRVSSMSFRHLTYWANSTSDFKEENTEKLFECLQLSGAKIPKRCENNKELIWANSLSFNRLTEMVVLAHHTRTRIEIQGYSSQSMKLILTQRTDAPSTIEGHRTFEEAWEDMRSLYEPLLPEHSEFTRQLAHVS